MEIREATISDVEAMLAIYAPYVEQTAITFEYDVPTIDDFRQRLLKVQAKYPWIVAQEDGRIVGYAYASAFKERAAYQWAVETSIYVDGSMKRCGIGRQLHKALEQRLKAQGILNMNACISYIETEDEYLTQDSVRFHEQLGYKKVAHFHLCGKKFGRWYDMIWMEKIIGEHDIMCSHLQKKLSQIERIKWMEQRFNKVLAAIKDGSADSLKAVKEDVTELSKYYGSELWKQDFAADEAGTLPPDLKRGVLSEDGLWNLLSDYREIQNKP